MTELEVIRKRAAAAQIKRRWGYRIIRLTRKRGDIELLLAGRRAHIRWDSYFDRRGGGTRGVFSAGIDIRKHHYSILLQHYREGYDFDAHTDGISENKVLSILLRRPKAGGEFYIQGPQKSWLGGRIRLFDGGRYSHGVTRIIRGSRTILMIQRGR